jgi:hypothetical protein
MLHSTQLIRLDGLPLHHCASITKTHNDFWTDEIWLAFYFGAECTDEQRVMVKIISESGKPVVTEPLILEGKTGNPLIFEYNGNVFLLCSKFEENSEIAYPVERWKYCSNHLYQL